MTQTYTYFGIDFVSFHFKLNRELKITPTLRRRLLFSLVLFQRNKLCAISLFNQNMKSTALIVICLVFFAIFFYVTLTLPRIDTGQIHRPSHLNVNRTQLKLTDEPGHLLWFVQVIDIDFLSSSTIAHINQKLN